MTWSPLYNFEQLRANRTLPPRKWGVYVSLFREETALVLRYVGSAVGQAGLWSRILFDREDALKSFVPEHVRQRVLVTWYPLESVQEGLVRALERFLIGFLQPPGNRLYAADRWSTEDFARQSEANIQIGVALCAHLRDYATNDRMQLLLSDLPWLPSCT